MKNQENNYVFIQVFLMSASLTIALIMLNAPIWLISIAVFLLFSPLIFGSLLWATIVYIIYDIVRPILYIWALVVTIQGKQDFIAIAFYILAALQVINILKRFFGTVLGLFATLMD